jgi:hypothetical protein
MRRHWWIGLVVSAGLQFAACTDHNPRYRPRVVTDGGGGGRDVSTPVDAPARPDTASDQSPASDSEPPVDVAAADGPAPPDGPPVVPDTGNPDLAAMPDTTPDLPPDAFVPPAGCGTMTTNVALVANADGVVVDTDGVIYTLTDDATNSYVGRIPPGGTAEADWLSVDDSPTTWGLALDSAAQTIYVLVVDGPGALVRFRGIKAAATGDSYYSGINNGNDVVVGPNGWVYYTQQSDFNVYAILPDRTRRKVTTTPVGSASQLPAGLTFDPDGNLIVGLEEGPLFRLSLTSGVESGRVQLSGWTGWANGLAHDYRGRLYVAQYHDTQSRTIVRLDITGNAVTGSTTVATGGRFSSIAFGRGPLDCRDLYIADPFGPMRRVRVPGL